MGALKVWNGSAWDVVGQGGGQLPVAQIPHGEFITTTAQNMAISAWETRTGWVNAPNHTNNSIWQSITAGVMTIKMAGLYEFTVSVGFEGTTLAGSRRLARLLKNGATPELLRHEKYASASAGADVQLLLSTQVYMNANDTIQVDMYQNTNAVLPAVSIEGSNRFSFLRVAL